MAESVRVAQSNLAVIDAPQQIETDRETAEFSGRVMVPGEVTLTIDGDPVPVAADGSFRVRRQVPVGRSRLTLVLEGSYGDKAEHKVFVRRRAAVTEKVDFGTFHALVIGNNNYDHFDDLETASTDAEAVAALLSEHYGFAVETLIDPTRYDIISALARKRAQLTERDNLLIYYAGHGVLDASSDEGYWLPTDAESDNPGYWISNTTVSNQLRAMSAKHVMVVADSCYSGRLTRSAVAVLKTGAERTVWLKNTNARRSRTVLTSGGLAPVVDGGTHSVFAQAFLTALQTADQILDGESLFKAVKPAVKLAANQTPEYSDIRKAGHDGGDFLFVPERPLGPAVVEVPMTGQTPALPSAGGATAETVFWQSIQGSQNPAAFDEYLRRFPNGTFTRLAELKRERLGQTQGAVPRAVPSPADERAADSIELAFWGAIKESASISDYEAYLTQFPKGHFAALARSRIAGITRFEAAEAARKEAARKAAAEAARKEAERMAAAEAARKEAERMAAEEARRKEVARKAAEEAKREEAERIAAEVAAREAAERKAAEEAERKEAERIAAEVAAREAAERKAAEEAERKEAERIAAEEAAREAAELMAAELAESERRAAMEREETQIAAAMPPGTDPSTTRIAASDPTAPRASSSAAIDRSAEDRILQTTFWQTYEDSTDPAVFDGYLSLFPNGVYAKTARQKRDALRKGSEPESSATPPDAPTTDLADIELAFWESIENSTDPGDYEAYLQRFPEGHFAHVAKLSRMRLLAAERSAKETKLAMLAPIQQVTETVEARVAATDDWRDTGVYVLSGKTYKIRATGTWSAGILCGDTDASGAGVGFFCIGSPAGDSKSPSTLVGRIGRDGSRFKVGNQLDLNTDQDGNLYLRMNDELNINNSGAVNVRITWQSPAKAEQLLTESPEARAAREIENILRDESVKISIVSYYNRSNVRKKGKQLGSASMNVTEMQEITNMEVVRIHNNIITIRTDYQWEWESGSQGASYQFLWQGGSQRHAGSDVGIATLEKYGSTYKVLKFETGGMNY